MIIVTFVRMWLLSSGTVGGCVVLVRRLVFVIVVQRLFVFEQFKQTKYIQSETKNQINGHQYVAELESNVF